jgi:hypothetical protein
VGRHSRDVLPLEEHLSEVALDETRHQVEKGTLACTVGADDGPKLTLTDFYADSVNGANAAEVLPEVSGQEDRVTAVHG